MGKPKVTEEQHKAAVDQLAGCKGPCFNALGRAHVATYCKNCVQAHRTIKEWRRVHGDGK